jgi:hypothetical protein
MSPTASTQPLAEGEETVSTSSEVVSDRDRAILSFEAAHPQHGPAKDEAIREVFALPSARYYQLLNAVIDSPAAVRHDPMLVARLQRAREARAQARESRAFRI